MLIILKAITGYSFQRGQEQISVPQFLPITGALILLILPAIFSAFTGEGPLLISYAIKEIAFALLFFLIPLAFFYRNIKLYLYLLLPLVLLSPFFIFSMLLYGLRPRFELLALVMQTNLAEMSEAVAGYLSLFIPFFLVYALLYLYCIKKTTLRSLPPKLALWISLLAGLIIFGKLGQEKELFSRPLSKLNTNTLSSVTYYPFSLIGAGLEAYTIMSEGRVNVEESFSFHAFPKDSIAKRKLHVLIIGESSRYDRWQINGYPKPTSPRLLKRKNLISFPHVIAGSNQTRMSVPQMITRATPDNIKLQYREKNIFSAFGEMGFKTAWLSNQTDKGMLWSGSINWHAKTAHVSSFSPSHSPNFEFGNYYDERLLPQLDSLLQSSQENIFIVLHTLGSHWNYAKRYPDRFDIFKPSGKTVSIDRPSARNSGAISNSYDNTILYADFIIDSVISTLDKLDAISSVMYISDHGEALFNPQTSQINFHLNVSAETLHIPLFIWTSEEYRHAYPDKWRALTENKHKKVGAENTFYTLLDLANVGIKEDEPTKSLASSAYTDSEQKYLCKKTRKGFHFSQLLKQ